MKRQNEDIISTTDGVVFRRSHVAQAHDKFVKEHGREPRTTEEEARIYQLGRAQALIDAYEDSKKSAGAKDL